MSRSAVDGCAKLLKIAIVGAPNAGKSTLLNRLIGNNISCVSNKVHTTRKNILGVYTHHDNTQLKFYDSPGIVNRKHILKHGLEDSMITEPEEAVEDCDMIAVLQDISNIREQKMINQGIVKLLQEHCEDKKAILIMNKVDLFKDKRALLDIGTRLTEGCIDGKLTLSLRKVLSLPLETVRELNLIRHYNEASGRNEPVQSDYIEEKYGQGKVDSNDDVANVERKYKHVYELQKLNENIEKNRASIDELYENPDIVGVPILDDYANKRDTNRRSFDGFSNVFSISALNNDGVDELRHYLLCEAKPIEKLPHGPDYITNLNTKEIVHAIIRGKLMDNTDRSVPYSVTFRYYFCNYDDMGSLHVNLRMLCPEKYMISNIVGDKGVKIHKIIEESISSISNTLGCDVKLDIQVDYNALRKKESI